MGIDFTYFYPISGAQDSFIYPLTAILFLFAVISFVKGKFDLLNPSFIYSICLTGCCLLAAVYTEVWGLPMHFNSAMILLVMSLLFLLGGYWAESAVLDPQCVPQMKIPTHGFSISWPLWSVFLFIMLYMAYLNYRDFLYVASQVTNETEFSKMLGPVNNGFAHRVIELGRWNAYRFRFAMALSCVSVLAVCINVVVHQYKEVLKWSCFIALFLPFMVLTGGRQQFMYLVIYSMITFFLVYRKYNWGKNSLGKETMIIGIALVSFLIFFIGIGVINGKIGLDKGIFRVLVHYAGTNISAFDVFINEMTVPDGNYIGTTTLVPIYSFLHNHGVDVPQFFQYITRFTALGPVTTNVYTAFYRYINDFGYTGCAILMLLIGFLYTFLYRKMYVLGLKNWMILVYASNVYPIFLMGREERFFNEILTTSRVSFIVLLILLYKFFEFMSNRKEEKNEC